MHKCRDCQDTYLPDEGRRGLCNSCREKREEDKGDPVPVDVQMKRNRRRLFGDWWT